MRLPARHKLRSSACTRPPQKRHYVKTYDFSQPLILSGHKRPMSSRVKHNSNPPLCTPLNQCLGCLKGYPTFSNHKLGSDVISGPIAVTSRWSILIPPPPPPEACCGLATHKQELCCPLHNLHSIVTLQSRLRWPISITIKTSTEFKYKFLTFLYVLYLFAIFWRVASKAKCIFLVSSFRSE